MSDLIDVVGIIIVTSVLVILFVILPYSLIEPESYQIKEIKELESGVYKITITTGFYYKSDYSVIDEQGSFFWLPDLTDLNTQEYRVLKARLQERNRRNKYSDM